jgi:hypothetical protein
VRVPTKNSGRVSIARLIATKPGHGCRLVYRTRRYRGRKGEQKGFVEADYAALFDAAHQQLGGPLVVVWDCEDDQVPSWACPDRGLRDKAPSQS